MAICVECAWCHDCLDGTKITCNNPEMPITDFVMGVRYCVSLNHNGTCAGFKKPLPIGDESIYKTKADEELARVSPEVTESLKKRGIES